jgi:hypothetical protein
MNSTTHEASSLGMKKDRILEGLAKKRPILEPRKSFFSQRVAEVWNKLQVQKQLQQQHI